MRGSIKTRLLVLALGAVAAAWLGTVVYTYFEAREELDELLDAHLAQSAALLIAQAAREIDDLEEEQAPVLHKYARRVAFQVWEEGRLRLRSANAPNEPLADDDPGFSERTVGKHRWRVFTSRDPRRGLVIHVGERAELRAKLARELALHLLQPLLYALPVLALLLWIAIARGLKPLAALREQVGRRAPDNLAPLDAAQTPREVQPLVDQLNALFRHIAESFESERRFTADAAHELRTPVAAVRAQAQVARGADDDASRVHALDNVIVGCDRATHLIEQLLTLARLDRARPASTQVCMLRSLAAESIAELAPQAVASGIQLELAEGRDIEIPGVATLLQVLLRNLIDNAIRYSPAGTAVRVSVAPVEHAARLTVCDQGPGIPTAELPKVRERFYRILGTGEEGSGLGLSIVQRIAEIHGTTLELAPGENGKGLCASVAFPLRA
jgi:two-component system sensor histidine kinase QseC